MKKLILVLTIFSVMLLGACASSDSPDLEEDTITMEELELRLEALEEDYIASQEQIDLLEERFNNLVVTTGLNGQIDYYENSTNNEDEEIFLSLSTYTYLTKEDEIIDVSKFPSYIWDINGDYITIDDLTKLLVNKYFPGTDAIGTIGIQFKITFTLADYDMTNDEFIARLSMLVIELSEYDYYTIDSPQLYVYAQFNLQTIEFKSRMSLLVTDKYNLTPIIFYEQLLDVSISGLEYDSALVTQYCDEFILNDTFINYVLNYN